MHSLTLGAFYLLLSLTFISLLLGVANGRLNIKSSVRLRLAFPYEKKSNSES